jgi:cyclophilin family peptidyl-prolyl cis-trans isomerase/ketosteroid isomerase-like protein
MRIALLPVLLTLACARAPDVIAIDILLDPDPVLRTEALATNARLRDNYPDGYALGDDNAPHITVIQRFVRASDLGALAAAVDSVVRHTRPTSLRLTATGYYAGTEGELALAGIAVAPTPELLAFQAAIIAAVQPYAVADGTAAAFVPRADGGAISAPTIRNVNIFVPAHTGADYFPHLTVGLAAPSFVGAMLQEPFTPLAFSPQSVSIYQLGNVGTAQKRLWSSVGGAAGRSQPLPSEVPLDQPAPDSFLVVFETTKGSVVVKAHRDWSPLGVDRLYHLARNHYYDGVVIYRVGPTASFKGGYVVQFGIGNSAAVNQAWDNAGIPDEPVRHPNGIGTVNFARAGPDSRTVELGINLTPNTTLDTVSYEGVVGFPPIAEVVEGMAVLESLNRQYGNTVFEQWDSVMASGRAYLDRAYPGLDRVDSAFVSATWPAGAPDSSAIVGVVDGFHAALAAGDSVGALSYLAPDAVILESGDLETRAEYEAHHLGADMVFTQAVPSTRVMTKLVQNGDVAWVASISTSKGAFRGREISSQGAELIVVSRTDAGWQIRAIHWSSRRL